MKKIKDIITQYFKLKIGASAAELSYYFLFSVFPIIMVASAVTLMLGENDSMPDIFERLLPDMLSRLFSEYYGHISSQNNRPYLTTGLILSFYTVTRYINSMKRKIRDIYSSSAARCIYKEWSVSFLFSVLIIVGFYLTLILQSVGETILGFISENVFYIPQIFIDGWLSLRFVAIGLYVFFILLLSYKIIPGKALKLKDAVWGTIFATTAWLIVSFIFSYYVDNIARYSVLYGSIGAFMVLMLWLYLINNIMLIGALLNKEFEKR